MCYTPSGRSIQASGIEPDIKVAFIPPKPTTPTEEERRVMREKDLEGHIETEPQELKEEEESKISPDERSNIQKRIDNDNQLSSAIRILQSWNLLFKIESRQTQE